MPMLRDISYSTLAHNIGLTRLGSDSLCAPTDLVFFKGSSHAHAHQKLFNKTEHPSGALNSEVRREMFTLVNIKRPTMVRIVERRGGFIL